MNKGSNHRSLTNLDELKNCDARKLIPCGNNNWTLSDAIRGAPIPKAPPKISIKAFNHVSREVLSLEKSKEFYCDILGFQVIPRPPFDSEGYWLFGHGLNLHLVMTTTPKYRSDLKVRRIQHFSYALPRVDHVAFITEDIESVKTVLDHYDVFYKHEKPENTGIEQIFLFDPDGNVIEISNCAPDIGETTCITMEVQRHEDTIVCADENETDEYCCSLNANFPDEEEQVYSKGQMSQATDCEGEYDVEEEHSSEGDEYSLDAAAVYDNFADR